MSQILEQEATHSDAFYKKEIKRMLEQMQVNNKKMESDQAEIDRLAAKSKENLKRIDLKIKKIESILT